jgi:hypothetical protein
MIHKKAWTNSSQIRLATYNDQTKELYITFVKGAEYRYLDVPEETWEKLIKAESAGSFFIYNINGSFKYERI